MIRYLEIVLTSTLHDRLQNVGQDFGGQNLVGTGVSFEDLRNCRVTAQETESSLQKIKMNLKN